MEIAIADRHTRKLIGFKIDLIVWKLECVFERTNFSIV